ncbi:MAG: formimidoylglutamate deiminase [Paralcaligenes sp.]
MSVIYEVEHLYQADGWLSPGFLEVGANGQIANIGQTAPDGNVQVCRLSGFCVPGMANLHSHAFQRALVGRTEFVTDYRTDDNLWTWRKAMYELAQRLTPRHYEAIAAQVYLEMLEFGITNVCEFHYVHHDIDGKRYANPSEMSERLIAAAEHAGIGMTLLPVLYAHSGVGKPPTDTQRRFTHSDVDEYLRLIESIREYRATQPALQVGMALHSLRAVAPGEIRAALEGITELDSKARLHIHASETTQEVDEIKAGLGARPVQWLLDNVALDERWSIIHATHLDSDEIRGLAGSKAVAGLCPLTEATMGDGYFPLVQYHQMGGAWGIGTDSHYSTSIVEELRILECGQRLETRRRNVIAMPRGDSEVHSGRTLFDTSLAGGEQSAGQNSGALVAGRRADLVMLDSSTHNLLGHGPNTMLDSWILGGTQNPVRDVMVNGKWVIKDRHHSNGQAIRNAFVETIHSLMD